MIGASLSRWTMAYFAAALLALLLAEALMAAGFGYPATTLTAPETLIVVHLVTLGWLSLLMCGALLQFVPVLVATKLHANGWGLPALLLLVAGLIALLCGFWHLATGIGGNLRLLTIGPLLLIAGFAIVIWDLLLTLRAAPHVALPARFVVAGLVCLVFAAGLGTIFALVLEGATSNATLAALTRNGVSIHVIAGLGGWLTFTAFGVSYRLLAMFMLAPELDGATTRAAFYLGCASLTVAILGGIIAAVDGSPGLALIAALGLGIAGLGFYGRDIVTIYRQRRRPIIELNSRVAAYALACLALSVLLLLALLLTGNLGRHVGALVFLLTLGWLSGLGLSQLYKITAFMTWLESYGPVLGKAPTPRVQDLVIERHAQPWFLAYFAGVLLGTLALLAEFAPGFRVAAAIMLLGTAGIVHQLWRTRRLIDVPADKRILDGMRQPRLLMSIED